VALSEHYYILAKGTKNEGMHMNFIYNYALDLRGNLERVRLSKDGLPVRIKIWSVCLPYVLDNMYKFIHTDNRFGPEAIGTAKRGPSAYMEFDTVAEQAIEGLDRALVEFCEYTEDLDDAERMLTEEIEKGRDKKLWKECKITYIRNGISPMVMLTRLRQWRKKSQTPEKDRNLIFFGKKAFPSSKASTAAESAISYDALVSIGTAA
jgi:hypothetical protein